MTELVQDPTHTESAPSTPASKPPAAPVTDDERCQALLAENRALQAQIAELTGKLLASHPTTDEAIREELRTFPPRAGTRYFVGAIGTPDGRLQTARAFDDFERECDLIVEEFKAFDSAGQHPKVWHVARGKRRSEPADNDTTTAASAEAPVEPAPALKGTIIQDAVPVMSLFTNLMRRNPLVERVWTHGAEAAYNEVLDEANERAVNWMFDRLEAQNRASQFARVVDGDDL